MVRGLTRFKEHFEAFTDQYALIGGTACFLSMDKVGLDFRATKDLDIVLCVEALDQSFVAAFWEFIRQGQYQNQRKGEDRKLFYRFDNPVDDSFPIMLELFSRVPNALKLRDDSHLTPIPTVGAADSLSAILLDDAYYHFIHTAKLVVNGLSIIGPECLVPLKARAWLDMVERRALGAQVDKRDISKHRNDVFRLFQILSPDVRVVTPQPVLSDLQRFLNASAEDSSINLKTLGLRNITVEEVIGQLRTIYGLDHR